MRFQKVTRKPRMDEISAEVATEVARLNLKTLLTVTAYIGVEMTPWENVETPGLHRLSVCFQGQISRGDPVVFRNNHEEGRRGDMLHICSRNVPPESLQSARQSVAALVSRKGMLTT